MGEKEKIDRKRGEDRKEKAKEIKTKKVTKPISPARPLQFLYNISNPAMLETFISTVRKTPTTPVYSVRPD